MRPAVRLSLRLAGLIGLLCLLPGVWAQAAGLRVELAVINAEDQAIVHVMVPRGQTVEQAAFVSGGTSFPLEPSPVEMPVTRWVLLDAGSSLLNLQPAVQSALTRFLRDEEGRTGFVYYDDHLRTLVPTDRRTDIDAFLGDYTTTANRPACLLDALTHVADAERDLDRSWRILLISGELTRQDACVTQDLNDLPPLPAPVDVIAVGDTVDDILQAVAERSGGRLTTANLRTIEARINEVRTLWARPSYALSGPVEELAEPRGRLTITLANGLREEITVRFTRLEPGTPDVVLATIPPQRPTTAPPTIPPTRTPSPAAQLPSQIPTDPTDAPEQTAAATTARTPTPTATSSPAERTEQAVAVGATRGTPPAVSPTAAPSSPTPAPAAEPDGGPLAGRETLIAGLVVVLLGVSGILLWLALASRRRQADSRRSGGRRTQVRANFYETLDQADSAEQELPGPTQPGTPTGGQPASDITLPPLSTGGGAEEGDQAMIDTDHLPSADEGVVIGGGGLRGLAAGSEPDAGYPDADYDEAYDEEDELLITQILDDERFQQMIASSSTHEVIGYIRVDGPQPADYELRPPGATIGRSRTCDIVVRGDPAVSREHIRLDAGSSGRVLATRLSHTNPVVVNGQQIEADHPLRPNDVVHLSDRTRLIFIASQPGGPALPIAPDDEPPAGDDGEDNEDDAITLF